MSKIGLITRPILPEFPGKDQIKVNKPDGEGFGDFLSKAIQSVNDMQLEAGEAQDKLIRGEAAELHQVMIAAEKAGISFDLLLEIRKKLLEAYQEIVRMPM
ncbi:MAG: flagellar hook-basal body complex protein FliE [candidate division Zixibacteria bacterium]